LIFAVEVYVLKLQWQPSGELHTNKAYNFMQFVFILHNF